MRFRVEQRYPAEHAVVLAALVDPDYLTEVMGRLPDLSAPVIESQTRTADAVRQRLRYKFEGSLPSAVLAVIKADRLSWHEDSVVDLTKGSATFTMTPIHYPKFFTCTGSWTLRAEAKAMSVRIIEGNLKVNSPIPFTGGQIEKAIVSGLEERLAKEPAAFAAWRKGS